MTEIEKAVEEIGRTLPPTSQKAYEAGQPNAVWGLTDEEFDKVNALLTTPPMVVRACRSRNGSFPAQWDGTLASGLFFFGHYRHGSLRVTLGTTPKSAILGVELCYVETERDGGEMDTAEFIKHATEMGALDFSGATVVCEEGY